MLSFYTRIVAIALLVAGSSARHHGGSGPYSGSLKKLLIIDSPQLQQAMAGKAKSFHLSLDYTSQTIEGSEGSIDGVPFGPMLKMDESASHFQQRAERAIKAGANVILGPNEPNLGGTSPSELAAHWKSAIEPVLRKYSHVTAVSPALANTPDSPDYLASFIKACRGCKIDKWAIHNYARTSHSLEENLQNMGQYIDAIKQVTRSSHIWVTETGLREAHTQQQSIEYIKAVYQYLKQHSSVEMLGVFPALHGAQFARSNHLTQIGATWGDI